MATNRPADPRSDVRLFIAIAALLGFAAFYFLQPMQNFPLTRPIFWLLVPEGLLGHLIPQPDAGWRYLPQRFDLLATAAALLIGAAAIGSLLLRLLDCCGGGQPRLRDVLTDIERLVLATGLGLSAWSLFTLACGLAGWLSQPLFAAVLTVAVVGAAVCWMWQRTPRVRDDAQDDAPRVVVWGCVGMMLPFLAAGALGAMLPPFDFDVREYHLGGPKEFFLTGRVQFLPHNVYTSFPFLTEMLSLSAMVLRGDWFRGALAGQLLLWVFYPLTAATVYAVGRRLFSPAAGWLAATIYATTPWSYRISIIAYAEGGLTAYLALALLAGILAMQQMQCGNAAARWVLLTGLLAGSGMACKYPGAVQVVIPLGVALLWAAGRHANGSTRRVPASEVAKTAAVFAVGVLLAVGPWLLKNLVETGNPVYPLLWSVFGGIDWDAAINAKFRAGHSPTGFGPAVLLRELYNVVLGSDWQSLLVFGLAPFALLRPRRATAFTLWGFVLYLLAAWWLLTHRIDRFWLPLLPVACLLAGAGALWSTARSWRGTVAAVGVIAVLYNLAFATSPLSGANNYLSDLDIVTATTQDGVLKSLNETLPPTAKVLLVGEVNVFDARFANVYNTVFDRNLFEDWTAQPRAGVPAERWTLRPPAEIRRVLAEQGITHVLVNWGEILRYRTTYGYSAFVTPDRFAALQAAGVLETARPMKTLMLAQLNPSEQAEAVRRFPELIRGVGERRQFLAAELYPLRP